MRKGLLHRDQRGFTLVEMLVVVALVGLIAFGLTTTISQIFNVSSRTSNRMIAVRQVQQAGKEVSKDILQSQNVTCSCSPVFGLNLTWADWLGANHEVIYWITEDGTLERWHRETDGGVVTETTRVIAQYIDPDLTSCSPCGIVPGNVVVVFTVTAEVGGGPQGSTETRTYEIDPRPDS